MPLDEFIAETMRELAGDSDEVAVGQARNLAAAAGLETSKKVFAGMNPSSGGSAVGRVF